MSRTTIARLDRLDRGQGDDWRLYVGRPDEQWPEDAKAARVAEDILGIPVPNIEVLTDAELGTAIDLLKSKIVETEN